MGDPFTASRIAYWHRAVTQYRTADVVGCKVTFECPYDEMMITGECRKIVVAHVKTANRHCHELETKRRLKDV
jgi:hypothetical protein